MMRWLLTILTWIVSTAILGAVSFFAVMIVAGPHSSMLPSPVQPAVLLLGWVIFIGGPFWMARWVWRRAVASPRSPE
jgi:hypothetical protein